MRLHTISWFVVLVCFCDEGYFKEANNEFQTLCVILTFPGSNYSIDPSELKPTWDTSLSYIGRNLFGSINMKENLKIAKDRCKDSKTGDDLSCAFIDFVTIGNLVGDDALNLQKMFSSKSQPYPYYYDLYIGAWLMHPRIARLDCGPPLKHLWQFLNTLRSLKSFDEYSAIKSLYGNITSKGLRQEIDRLCPVSSTEKICMIRRWTNIADKIDKFLTYVTRDQWENRASKMLRNTMQLYFYAAQLQILKWHRSSGTRVFAYRIASEVKIWIKEITEYIFDSLQNNDIETLRPVLELLPYTVHLPCDDTAEFLSMDRTMCTFKSMIDSLSWYLAGTNTRGNIKLISTTIDYEKFLQERRFEQILNIAETTQNNLQLVAQHLKLAMKNNFGELSTYFQTLAEFDKKKAVIDIDGITKDLDQYKKASEQSSKTLNSLMSAIVKAALSATIGDQIETALGLSFAIADLCNPLSTIFGGGNTKDTFDATKEVSQAMVGVAKAAKLKHAFDSLISEIRKFVDKLSENEIYLKSVAHLIKSLKAVSSSSSSSLLSSLWELKAQINTFFELYNNYDPAVTKYDLRAITAVWENLIDEACDILDSTSGIISGVTKTVLAAYRICPNAKVEVQKLITIYEEIYDFQFELMDSLSACMRAFTSFQASSAINSDFDGVKHKYSDDPDILEKLNLISAFSMISYKISMLSAIDSYCNILAYTEGRQPRECIGPKTSITSLLSETKLTCTTSLEFMSIPTKPSKPGDKAFISLIDLYAGNTVPFKIPDSQWLIEHKWISSFQQDDKIFVQRFEIYLPVVSRIRKQVHVEVEATVENQLSPPDGTEYVISPRIKLGFTYREGESGRKCRQAEIPNPYFDNCRDMPNICPVTTEFPKCRSLGNICPSIYAHWNIKMYGYKNANLTVPSTNMPLRVALQLCSFPSLRQMKNYNRGLSKSFHAVEQPRNRKAYNSVSFRGNGACCKSNQYYDEFISKCTACPSGTVDKYGGLFCANTFRFVLAPTSDIPFSLAHAQKACTEAGTTIALKKTIEEAVAHGYDECRCGWLSEGTMVSPKPNHSCKKNGGLSTVTCTSSNTWGVYCNNIF